jgi:hypothetical protein
MVHVSSIFDPIGRFVRALGTQGRRAISLGAGLGRLIRCGRHDEVYFFEILLVGVLPGVADGRLCGPGWGTAAFEWRRSQEATDELE